MARGATRARADTGALTLARACSVSYALESLQDRGVLFLAPGAKVYEGMIIGENSRDNDLEVLQCARVTRQLLASHCVRCYR